MQEEGASGRLRTQKKVLYQEVENDVESKVGVLFEVTDSRNEISMFLASQEWYKRDKLTNLYLYLKNQRRQFL